MNKVLSLFDIFSDRWYFDSYSCLKSGHIFVNYEYEDWEKSPPHCYVCGYVEEQD